MREHHTSSFYYKKNEEVIKDYIDTHIGRTTTKAMAEHFNCSINTMRRWIGKSGYPGGIRKNSDKLNTQQISEIIGIPVVNFIACWKKHGFKPRRFAGYCYTTFEQLEDFMQKHPDLWDANLCDESYFIGKEWFYEIKRNGNNKIVKKRWSPQEISLLKILWENGKSVKDVSFRLSRSEEAVKKKLYRYYGGLTDGHRIKKV